MTTPTDIGDLAIDVERVRRLSAARLDAISAVWGALAAGGVLAGLYLPAPLALILAGGFAMNAVIRTRRVVRSAEAATIPRGGPMTIRWKLVAIEDTDDALLTHSELIGISILMRSRMGEPYDDINVYYRARRKLQPYVDIAIAAKDAEEDEENAEEAP